MEYIYAALLLHKAGKEVNEEAIKKVMESSGIKYDEAKGKALVAALSEVNIDEALKTALTAAPTVGAPATTAAPAAEPKKPKKEEEKEGKKEEEALAGLSALFG